MDIGRVLLRDAHYVWRERVAVLEKNAVVLQPPLSAWQAAATAIARSSKKTKPKRKQKPEPKLTKQRSKPPSVEPLPLDGSISCEGIVVSSAHMHSVRLQDMRSGREFLVDVTTKGKKHMWIDLFASARSRADICSSWRGELALMDANDDEEVMGNVQSLTRLSIQQAVEMLVAASESDTETTVIRGCDVEDILLGDGSAADFTESEAFMLARKLVDYDVLLPFCCTCSFVYRADRVYRVNTNHRLVKEAQMMSIDIDNDKYEDESKQDGSRRCRGHLLWLHDRAFQELLAQFDRQEDGEEGISGTDGVQALLRFGAYSVPTALALANELLHHEFIVECYSSNKESGDISFQMNTTTARYKKVCADTSDNAVGDDDDEKRRAIASSERAARSLEDKRRIEVQIQKLKEKYTRLFNLFCFCCMLVLLDVLVATVLLPGPLTLSLVTGLLLWLTLIGGSATFSINIQPRNHLEELNRTPQGVGYLTPKEVDFQKTHFDPQHTIEVGVSTTSSFTGATMKTSRAAAVAAESMDRVVIVLTRAEEAEVHSFRVAIAQAAAIPVEATHVFSDEYLFSVLRVKNRAFAYAVTKLAHVMEWRRIYEVDTITWDDVKAQLVSGNMYWYGYDFQNRPILWVRAKLKNWATMSRRRDVEVRAHVYLLELCCRCFMPPGVTTYTIVTDSSGTGMAQVDLRLMRGLLDMCVANFPDRIGLVHAGPLTRFLKFITSWLWPFLPIRLRGKVSLMHDCATELAKHMNTDLIPLHMGGTAVHNLRAPPTDPTEADDIMDITCMIDQQMRFMEELKNPAVASLSHRKRSG